MQFFDLDALVVETKRVTASGFAKLHPHVAIVIEDFVPAPENMTSDDPTWADTHTDADFAEKPDPKASLRPLKAGSRGLWLKVDPASNDPQLRIGRDAANEISLPNPRISRHHATIRYSKGARTWFLLDEDSGNGTTLNGKLVRLARLGDGDFVVLGRAAVLRPFFNPVVFFERLRELRKGSES